MRRALFALGAIVVVVLVMFTVFSPQGSAQGSNVYSWIIRNNLWNYGNTFLPPVTVAGTAGALTISDKVTYVKLTGTTKQTSIVTSTADAGRLLIIETASTDTLVDGSNLKLVGDFIGTADDILMLISDGTNWREIGRNAN